MPSLHLLSFGTSGACHCTCTFLSSPDPLPNPLPFVHMIKYYCSVACGAFWLPLLYIGIIFAVAQSRTRYCSFLHWFHIQYSILLVTPVLVCNASKNISSLPVAQFLSCFHSLVLPRPQCSHISQIWLFYYHPFWCLDVLWYPRVLDLLTV